MAEESFLSAPNLFWFTAGLAAEFFFLGFGITPQGMNVAAQVAGALGLMDNFNTVAEVAGMAGPAMGGITDTLDFGIR